MGIGSRYEKDDGIAYPEEVSQGGALGPLEHFEASYDAQVRASSQFGLEAAMRAEEVANSERIRAAGGTPPQPLNGQEDGAYFGGFTAGLDSGAYSEYLRAADDEDGARLSRVIGDRDQQLKTMQSKYPNAGILDYEQIRSTTFKKALDAEQKVQRRSSGFMSSVAGFFGSVAGSLDPRTSPLNVLTAPVGGGFGRTLLGRVALDAGVGGATTALTEFGGTRETRQLLGLETNTFQDVAFGAAGGAAFSLAGEGITSAARAAGRRWFKSSPNDPAPAPDAVLPPQDIAAAAPGEPLRVTVRPRNRLDDELDVIMGPGRSPLATTPQGKARASEDFRYVLNNLEDWSGPRPWEVPPSTMTRNVPGDSVPVDVRAQIDAGVRSSEINVAMREIDPDTMRVWDKLADEDAGLRAQLDALDGRVSDILAEELAPLTQEISRLRQVSQTATRRNEKKYAARIAAMQDDIAARIEREAGKGASPEEMELRAQLLQNEQQRWDMQPVIQRTAARARQQWEDETSPLYAQISEMVRSGSKTVPDRVGMTLPEEMPVLTRDPIADAIPGLADMDSKPGETIPKKTIRMTDERMKATDETTDAFRTGAKGFLTDAEEVGYMEVNGTRISLDEKFNVGQDDDSVTEMSLRDILKDIEDDNTALQAVTSCSIVRPS